jgi:hypothetical protein
MPGRPRNGPAENSGFLETVWDHALHNAGTPTMRSCGFRGRRFTRVISHNRTFGQPRNLKVVCTLRAKWRSKERSTLDDYTGVVFQNTTASSLRARLALSECPAIRTRLPRTDFEPANQLFHASTSIQWRPAHNHWLLRQR